MFFFFKARPEYFSLVTLTGIIICMCFITLLITFKNTHKIFKRIRRSSNENNISRIRADRSFLNDLHSRSGDDINISEMDTIVSHEEVASASSPSYEQRWLEEDHNFLPKYEDIKNYPLVNQDLLNPTPSNDSSLPPKYEDIRVT